MATSDALGYEQMGRRRGAPRRHSASGQPLHSVRWRAAVPDKRERASEREREREREREMPLGVGVAGEEMEWHPVVAARCAWSTVHAAH